MIKSIIQIIVNSRFDGFIKSYDIEYVTTCKYWIPASAGMTHGAGMIKTNA
ncbi:MAG: hypothetical protein L6247_07310 [Desulfobacteraceae bacterium]|nr:hypothetical protein [Pseudomonadota bacterium]MBU4462388.1 hypothetical protein [Pseudomonadota bacterium]MCG2755354.1 hypothetical protein [Desulfobacteraceae bacterium]